MGRVAFVLQSLWGFVTRCHMRADGGRRFVVEGAEHVPRQGPALLCSNHPDYGWDPCHIATASSFRFGDHRFWTDAGLMGRNAPFRRMYLRAIGCIPVAKHDDAALRLASNAELFRATIDQLYQNAVIILFPEGRGGSKPPLQPLRTGFARVAQGYTTESGLDLPVVPCVQSIRKGAGVYVRFGEPLFLNRAIEDPNEAILELTARLDDVLNAMVLEMDFVFPEHGALA